MPVVGDTISPEVAVWATIAGKGLRNKAIARVT